MSRPSAKRRAALAKDTKDFAGTSENPLVTTTNSQPAGTARARSSSSMAGARARAPGWPPSRAWNGRCAGPEGCQEVFRIQARDAVGRARAEERSEGQRRGAIRSGVHPEIDFVAGGGCFRADCHSERVLVALTQLRQGLPHSRHPQVRSQRGASEASPSSISADLRGAGSRPSSRLATGACGGPRSPRCCNRLRAHLRSRDRRQRPWPSRHPPSPQVPRIDPWWSGGVGRDDLPNGTHHCSSFSTS